MKTRRYSTTNFRINTTENWILHQINHKTNPIPNCSTQKAENIISGQPTCETILSFKISFFKLQKDLKYKTEDVINIYQKSCIDLIWIEYLMLDIWWRSIQPIKWQTKLGSSIVGMGGIGKTMKSENYLD